MGARILAAIKAKQEALPKIGRKAILGHAHHILRNLNEIKGRNYSRQQIYRLVGQDEDVRRPGALENLFVLYCAVVFAPGTNSQVLADEVASWPEWAAKLAGEGEAPAAFWPHAEQLNALLGQLRLAFLAADSAECRAMIAEMQTTFDRLRSAAVSLENGGITPSAATGEARASSAGNYGPLRTIG